MLAVVWSLEKFNQYTYGRKVNVVSDHTPLESSGKPLAMDHRVCRNAMSTWCTCYGKEPPQNVTSISPDHWRAALGLWTCAYRRTRPHVWVPTWGDTHSDWSLPGHASSETDYHTGLARREATHAPTSAPILRNERRNRSIRRNRFPGRTRCCTSQRSILKERIHSSS